MNKQIQDLLSRDRLGVISVKLDDEIIHSATIHFSHLSEPDIRIFIQTSNTTLKAKPFLHGQVGKGAMVIGFSEEDWLTLQMHGDIRAISDNNELEAIYKIHYQKHPEAEQYKGLDTIFLEFKPTWWRYTDFNTEPETIISS